jgi:putative membrane protein
VVHYHFVGYLASIFAFWMLFFTDLTLGENALMHVNLVLYFWLYLYHAKCHQIFKQLQNDEVKYSTNFMRLWNEGAPLSLP